MKHFFTPLLVILFAFQLIAYANPFSGIHQPVVHHKHLKSTNPQNNYGGSISNDIYVSLAAKIPADSPYSYISGASVHIAFDSSFDSNVYGPEDSQDFNSGGFGGAGSNAFAIPQGSVYLSIEGRQLPTVKDTILFVFQNPTATAYQLVIDANTFKGNGLKAYIYDSYLKKTSYITDSVTFVNFTVNPKNDSTFFNRFSIIFKSTSLAVNSISLNSAITNQAVTLNWKTVGENNLASYSVEKSTDGINYSSIGKVVAKNVFASTYTFTDNKASEGNLYYRIKAVSINGLVTYSSVSTIAKGLVDVSFGVYPNPIQNKVVNIKFAQVEKGSYTLRLFNSLGKQVCAKQIQHSGGSATYNTILDASLTNGIYKLSISSANGSNSIYTTNVLIQN